MTEAERQESEVQSLFDRFAALPEEQQDRFMAMVREKVTAWCGVCGTRLDGETCWGCWDSPMEID